MQQQNGPNIIINELSFTEWTHRSRKSCDSEDMVGAPKFQKGS